MTPDFTRGHFKKPFLHRLGGAGKHRIPLSFQAGSPAPKHAMQKRPASVGVAIRFCAGNAGQSDAGVLAFGPHCFVRTHDMSLSAPSCPTGERPPAI